MVFFKKGFLGRGFIRGGLFQRVLIQEGASLRRDYFERDLLTGAYETVYLRRGLI